MTLRIFGINAALSLALLLMNGIIGKIKMDSGLSTEYATFEFHDEEKNFSDNFFHAVVHPAIYIALASVVLQRLSLEAIAREIWLVIPLYWVYRFLHTLIWNRISLINWRYELPAFAMSLFLGELTLFLVIRPLIDNEKNIFINLEQFRDAFWFAAFVYLFKLLWDTFKKSATSDSLYPAEKKAMIIQHRYCRFYKKYNVYIEDMLLDKYAFPSNKLKQHFLCLVYSIMIYEDHCRPSLIRMAEYILKVLHWNCSFSLGIMQVQTKRIIGNKKSINLAIEKIYDIYLESKPNVRLYNTITEYNCSKKYYEEVYAIYNDLKDYLNLTDIDKQRVKVSRSKAAPRG